MNEKNPLNIKDKKDFLRRLALSKKRNNENNLRFVRLHALWLRRTSNKEWSRQQKMIIDEVYKANRHLKLNPTM